MAAPAAASMQVTGSTPHMHADRRTSMLGGKRRKVYIVRSVIFQ